MPVRSAQAQWDGKLSEGKGKMSLGSGTCECGFSFGSRFDEANGSNPEEFIGAALAGCYSMSLSKQLGDEGYDPQSIRTDAQVSLEKQNGAFAVSTIELQTQGTVPSITEDDFERAAQQAKEKCPVAQVLAGASISVTARLLSAVSR